MIGISVYGELPLPIYLYRLIFTSAVAKLVHISFTDNSKGSEARLPINCFRTSVCFRCFDDCKGSLEPHSSNSYFFEKIDDYMKE